MKIVYVAMCVQTRLVEGGNKKEETREKKREIDATRRHVRNKNSTAAFSRAIRLPLRDARAFSRFSTAIGNRKIRSRKRELS